MKQPKAALTAVDRERVSRGPLSSPEKGASRRNKVDPIRPIGETEQRRPSLNGGYGKNQDWPKV